MTIDPKQSIAGCGILRIRDFIKSYSNHEFDVRRAAMALELSQAKTRQILKWLEENEYIELVTAAAPKRCWTGTDHAGAFVNASARKQISRSTADRVLEELVERATLLNRTGEFAYSVRRITVWGSYLGTEATLGDVDVAVELKPLEDDLRFQQKLEEKRIRVAYVSGRRMRNLVEQIYWPQEEVFRFLKGRPRSCHFVSPNDRIFQQAAQKVVFESTKAWP